MKFIRLLCIVCCYGSVICAQEKNPFDLERSFGVENSGLIVRSDTMINNPFNISQTNTVSNREDVAMKNNRSQSFDSRKIAFWLQMGSLILLVFMRNFDPHLFRNLIDALRSHIKLSALFKRTDTVIRWNYRWLFLLFIVQLSFFIYLILERGFLMEFNNPLPLYWIVLLVFAYYIFKQTILLLMRYIYRLKPEINLYLNHVLIFSIAMGIVLIPVTLLISYGPEFIVGPTFWLGIILCLGTILFRNLRVSSILSSLLSSNFFYFLLYLCAVEISPLLIIYKMVN